MPSPLDRPDSGDDQRSRPLPGGTASWFPDLRAYGRSADLDPAETRRNTAGDIAELLDHLRIEKAILCGVSMGATSPWHSSSDSVIDGRPVLANTRSQADTEEQRHPTRDGGGAEAVGIDASSRDSPKRCSTR
jgi:hypothetical protein